MTTVRHQSGSTPSTFGQWPSTSASSTASSTLLFVLLCLWSVAHAQDATGQLSRSVELDPSRIAARRAWPLASTLPANGPSPAPSADYNGDDGDVRLVKRAASPTGAKLTAVNRTHQRSRHGGGSRRTPAHDSANDSERRSDRDAPSTSAAAAPWLHYRPRHHRQQHHQQRGGSTSDHHRDDPEEEEEVDEDDVDDEEEEVDEEFEEEDVVKHDQATPPSLLTFVSPRVKGSRDRMLKSSKDALIVTKKSYLKKDWCKTEPLIQKVREPGCVTRTIVNRFCYGQCNSFYIPKNAKMDIEATAFKSCSFCKPKRFRWITITLHCPGRNPPYKRKRIQRIKKCKCISEILQ